MSLTLGRGPFGRSAAGSFDFDPPSHIVYVEDFPRPVRAVKDGATVLSSSAVKLLHESDKHVRYSFPADAAELLPADAVAPDPVVPGNVVVPWGAVDSWFEEDQQVYASVRDPYHRIDAYASARHITVTLDGVVLADTTRAKGLYETGLPVRWYIPREDVRMELLVPTSTSTVCPYKGEASYWSARIGDREVTDVVWTYERELQSDVLEVASYLSFYDTKVEIGVGPA